MVRVGRTTRVRVTVRNGVWISWGSGWKIWVAVVISGSALRCQNLELALGGRLLPMLIRVRAIWIRFRGRGSHPVHTLGKRDIPKARLQGTVHSTREITQNLGTP